MHYLKQLPVQLVLSIVLAFILGSFLDVRVVSLFFSLSSAVIQTLTFVLPFMVFGFIFRALVNSQRDSIWMILLIFAGVTLSNCIALVISYLFSQMTLPSLGLTHSPDIVSKFSSDVYLLFSFKLPTLFGTESAMLSGITLGVLISFLQDTNSLKRYSQRLSGYFYKGITLFLQKIFIPLLPLYVFGFCLKISYDQALVYLFEQFGKVFLLSMTLVISYLFFLYFIGSGGQLKRTLQNIKTMLPAGLTGFSTMSSAATMPVTLACTEKTTRDRNFTDLIIPSTANIHMIGDDLTVVMMGMTLLSIFGMPWPDLAAFLPFMLAFSLAKLSCVGVPGASVLVILPVLQSHMNFSPEMISVLTTIYILQDSFGTMSNVMGNGAFALVIQRIAAKIRRPQIA